MGNLSSTLDFVCVTCDVCEKVVSPGLMRSSDCWAQDNCTVTVCVYNTCVKICGHSIVLKREGLLAWKLVLHGSPTLAIIQWPALLMIKRLFKEFSRLESIIRIVVILKCALNCIVQTVLVLVKQLAERGFSDFSNFLFIIYPICLIFCILFYNFPIYTDMFLGLIVNFADSSLYVFKFSFRVSVMHQLPCFLI